MNIVHTTLQSPIGPLLLATSDEGLRAIEFHGAMPTAGPEEVWREGTHPFLTSAREQLDAYFAGARRDFELPLAPQGTEFQRSVWRTLATIPYGETWTYAKLAQRVGRPTAFRAVGAANGRNPLPIVLPCHRVIGTNGTLTGFSGGLELKRALLRLEGALPHGELFDGA